ncbi:NXPE family member 3 isoform X1 [Oreochromis niloticus]|uniref:NXPE family member 3 isoform X1 n=1 Tax=Oreochromis niloticus TaxID=8128 RepID=UPI0009057A44|nr:NXPE family member 3 isoform X1 [Oreochromis niloticus]
MISAVSLLFHLFIQFEMFQKKINTTYIIPYPRAAIVTQPVDIHHNFCKLKPLSPEETLEEQLLLESIAWPETPSLPSPLFMNSSSDPAHSTFTILPRKREGQWQIGDKLEALIKIHDLMGRPKKYGGDVLLARLHNPTLGAGVAGQVVDHLNGSYSAVFSLLWEGSAEVEVTLVHPSEAVTELRRVNIEEPDRIYFKSQFRSSLLTRTTTCNVCLRPTEPVCNYTDLRTGEPWFCYKPANMSCDTRTSNYNGGSKASLTTMEKLFQSGVNMKVSIPASGPANVTVFPKQKGQLEVNSSSVESEPSGYYYQGVWRALGGTTVHQFNTSSAITQCLKGKQVYMYGDSTMRQWFEYLNAALPDLKEFNLHSHKSIGPLMALDYTNNIFVMFRAHGPPIRTVSVPSMELHYIANELDNVVGGSNTVVVFGIWAHFDTFPIGFYIRRLMSIRSAVVRLLSRAPGTVVVIRTGNPKPYTTILGAFVHSDWYTFQRLKALKAIFKGLNVHLVDAWEMVLAHHLPHSMHPEPPVIKNMINVLLSYICPPKGGFTSLADLFILGLTAFSG